MWKLLINPVPCKISCGGSGWFNLIFFLYRRFTWPTTNKAWRGIIALRQWKQELSYRKQIARKLRTQYVEGTHRPKYYTVTLKSRLRSLKVTGNGTSGQIIHDLLLVELFDVKYYRDLEMWDRGQSSGTIWKLGYGFLFSFHSNHGRIFSHFGDIRCQRMAWPWNVGLGLFKVIENGAVR